MAAAEQLLSPRIAALLGPVPIERINCVAATYALLCFAASVVIEAPCVFAAVAKSRRRRSLGGVALAAIGVNAISYVLIIGWFLWMSYTLPLNARVVKLSDLGAITPCTLYWIDPAGHVMARRLDRSESPHTLAAKVMKNDFVWPFQLRVERVENSDRVRLSVMCGTTTYRDRPTPPGLEPPDDPLILADAGGIDAFPSDYWDQNPMLRKNAFDLRPSDRRQRSPVGFDWYRNYLEAGGARLSVGLPWANWRMQEPTVLADDKIVFEWEGQIVLFDPRTHKLAYFAAGTCPAVVPEVGKRAASTRSAPADPLAPNGASRG